MVYWRINAFLGLNQLKQRGLYLHLYVSEIYFFGYIWEQQALREC